MMIAGNIQYTCFAWIIWALYTRHALKVSCTLWVVWLFPLAPPDYGTCITFLFMHDCINNRTLITFNNSSVRCLVRDKHCSADSSHSMPQQTREHAWKIGPPRSYACSQHTRLIEYILSEVQRVNWSIYPYSLTVHTLQCIHGWMDMINESWCVVSPTKQIASSWWQLWHNPFLWYEYH